MEVSPGPVQGWHRLKGGLAHLVALPHFLDALAAAAVVAGGILRFYQSTSLSYWLDEGFTVMFARQPWGTVLGLNGSYDTHPPLYYAVVKAVSLVLPEIEAGRYLSVAAGTAALAILYLLVVRVVSRPAALIGVMVAALSPLAVWYSQEARQYALTGLAVGLTYLALVAFYQGPRWRWAVLYGLGLAASMYLDYSALYALAPQVFLLPIVIRRHLRSAAPLVIAGVAAVVAYLPWLPQILATVGALGNQRASYLEANPQAVRESLLSIVGLAGQGIYHPGYRPSAWGRWPDLDPVMAGLAVLVLCLGSLALIRHRFGLAVALALSVGTVGAGVLFSQVSPGFAPRTVSYAVLGWAILLGAAVGARGLALPMRALGVVAVCAMIALSTVSLNAVYHGDKQHWRDWASGVAEATHLGYPVITFPTIAPTLIDAYQPGSLAGPHLSLFDSPDLAAVESLAQGQSGVWVATYNIAGAPSIGQRLTDLGFVRVVDEQYFYALSLDLYLRSGVTPGSEVDVNGAFSGSDQGATGWALSPGQATLAPGTAGRELTLSNQGGAETWAVRSLPGEPSRLYTLTFDAESRLTAGRMRAFVECIGGDGSFLNVAPDGGGAALAAGGGWQTVTFSVLCPRGTNDVRIDLRNAGTGDLGLRGVRLFEAAAP
jgi:hypothetical protein